MSLFDSILKGISGSPDDVLFGVIQSGRDTPVQGITEMVGPCITTVPLRIALDRTSTTVPQFLQMIQDQTTDMIKFEHAGLQNIQRMGRECRDACGFACVMVIQPPDVHDEASFLGAQKLSDEEKERLVANESSDAAAVRNRLESSQQRLQRWIALLSVLLFVVAAALLIVVITASVGHTAGPQSSPVPKRKSCTTTRQVMMLIQTQYQ